MPSLREALPTAGVAIVMQCPRCASTHICKNGKKLRILFELKLGRQASGYKTAQKALNQFIAELKLLAESFI